MKKTIYYSLIFCMLLLFNACDTKPKCKLSPPEPMFGQATAEIEKQTFELTGMKSVETVWFVNKTKLELIQDGCELVSQDFQFEIPENFKDKDNEYWALTAIECFKLMGKNSLMLRETANVFAETLLAGKDMIEFGEDMEMAPNFFMKLNKIAANKDYGILTISLFNKANN